MEERCLTLLVTREINIKTTIALYTTLEKKFKIDLLGIGQYVEKAGTLIQPVRV